MPFQSNDFVRNQNFVRDRDLGAPDNTISADKVDDEFDNVADALTATKTEVATVLSTVRGGIDEPRNTLKKLADWILSNPAFSGVLRAPLAVFGSATEAAAANVLHLYSAGDTHLSLFRGETIKSYFQAVATFTRIATRVGPATTLVLDLNDDGNLAWSGSSISVAGKRMGAETIGTGTPSGGQSGDKYFKV